MKKYVKPILAYEAMNLSQNVSGCGFDIDFDITESCQAIGDITHGNEGWNIFGGLCDYPVDDVDGVIVCYQNGTDTNPSMRVFNS